MHFFATANAFATPLQQAMGGSRGQPPLSRLAGPPTGERTGRLHWMLLKTFGLFKSRLEILNVLTHNAEEVALIWHVAAGIKNQAIDPRGPEYRD